MLILLFIFQNPGKSPCGHNDSNILGACRTYTSRLDFCPFSSGASLLSAPSEPPSFAFAALHGGFSSLLLSALFGSRVYDSHTRSKPTACFWCAAFVRFRRPPWRLFFAIAQRSLREASLRLASPLLRCQNAHVAQLRSAFVALYRKKNHQKSPRSLKVRQTPWILPHS